MGVRALALEAHGFVGPEDPVHLLTASLIAHRTPICGAN